jgi:anti-anti-sigma factor
MKLTYKPLTNDEILRVACEGQVSQRGKPPASEPMQELLGPHAYRQRVILNLERSDGIDTSGLMWLVRVASRFTQGGGKLVVYGFSPTFRQMLEVLGMVGTILTAPSEQQAIEVVTQSGAASNPAVAGELRPSPRAYPKPPATEVG